MSGKISEKMKRRKRKKRNLTIVCVQTPFSTSHKRTVESRPQLYAVFSLPTFPNTTRETLAVWDFSTVEGDFRLAFSAESFFPPFNFRLFFLSRSLTGASGTSSDEGTRVSQRPIKVSQEEVSKCVPDELDAIEETDAVCKCNFARVFDSELDAESDDSVIRVIWADKSCEEVAIRWEAWSSSTLDCGIGTTQREVIGAVWASVLNANFWE